MSAARLALATLVCLGLVLFLGRVAFRGLSSGKAAQPDNVHAYSRRENPTGFWVVILVLSFFACLSIYVWYRALQAVIGK